MSFASQKEFALRIEDYFEHHVHLNLPTHPHHKHADDEQNVVASPAPTLAEVLAEIERMVALG
ncbi:MAG: hypothetical protein IAE81_24335 [Caldilineaceae bacterium]|nr:hypothetical protein [Caldilineaceae bacterium]